jgi:hypothetical protein
MVAVAIAGGDAVAFPDVPPDHWAQDWIEWLSELGVVAGFPDGTYGPDELVSRAAMAVYIGRAIQSVHPARGVGTVTTEWDFAQEVKVSAFADWDAGEYRLYWSTDCVNWEVPPEVFWQGTWRGFVLWRVSGVTGTRYFKPVAVVNDVERELCAPLMARRGQERDWVTIDEPPQEGASRTPIVSWDSVPGAVLYVASVVAHEPDYHDVYSVLVEPWRTSARFGEVDCPGVIAGYQLVDALEPTTEYHVLVRGIDVTGWGFASSRDVYFATGP